MKRFSGNNFPVKRGLRNSRRNMRCGTERTTERQRSWGMKGVAQKRGRPTMRNYSAGEFPPAYPLSLAAHQTRAISFPARFPADVATLRYGEKLAFFILTRAFTREEMHLDCAVFLADNFRHDNFSDANLLSRHRIHLGLMSPCGNVFLARVEYYFVFPARGGPHNQIW